MALFSQKALKFLIFKKICIILDLIYSIFCIFIFKIFLVLHRNLKSKMPKLEICLSPELLHLYELQGKNVVVVDILRATSCMVTAFAHGIGAVIPVAKVEECKNLQNQGMLAAAERDGSKVPGFDLDNSPFSYMEANIKGQTIAVTTTNGTQAIMKSTQADQIIIGAFLNIATVTAHLKLSKKNTIIVCAGWKGNFNLEDTLFAGALAYLLKGNFELQQDGVIMALAMYESNKNNLLAFVNQSQHVRRLANLDIHKDIAFCLQMDVYTSLPVFKNDRLVA